MKATNYVLGLLFSVSLLTCSQGMEDSNQGAEKYRGLHTHRANTDPLQDPEAFKRLRFARDMYARGVQIEYCLRYVNETDCSDDNAQEIDEDRLDKALWIFVLDPSEQGRTAMKRVCELNLVSKSPFIELPYRIQSITLPLYSGCADEEWVTHYLPSLNECWVRNLQSFEINVARNAVLRSFGQDIKETEEIKAEIVHMSTTIGVVALNYLYGDREVGLELWEQRPTVEALEDLVLLERYNSEDPDTFLEDWKQAQIAQVQGDIEKAKATRKKPESPTLAPKVGLRGSVVLSAEDVVTSLFGQEKN